MIPACYACSRVGSRLEKTADIMRKLNSLITVLVLSFATLSATGCATSGDDSSEYGDEESSATSPGKFDLYQSSDAQWRFRVVAGNGRTLLSSEAYTTRAAAEN